MMSFQLVSLTADDLLDAVRTIPLGKIKTCDWLHEWIPAPTFLEWANRGLEEGGDRGLSNAICYAKRSACCRIDLLLRYNHLTPFFRENYPNKIRALGEIGVKIPEVVHELVIEPRNELEHNYRVPNGGGAKHAVDIADLFLSATESERELISIVAVCWNVNYTHIDAPERGYADFQGFNEEDPMLFIDIFDDEPAAKIVDPANHDVRIAELSSFSRDQSIQLALLLRKNRSQTRTESGSNYPTFYREMKTQGGF